MRNIRKLLWLCVLDNGIDGSICVTSIAETALELLNENERLKRQLELMVSAQDGIGGCPRGAGLPEMDCSDDPERLRVKCSDCWRKTLEEVK